MAQTTDIEAIQANAAFHRFDMYSLILSWRRDTPVRATLSAPIVLRFERGDEKSRFGEKLSRKGTSR
jgi:hypothetical protein